MNKVQAGRLLTLAWFLRTQVPKEHFDMHEICTGSSIDAAPESIRSILNVPTLSCGTQACAYGWSCAIFPELSDDGNDFFGITGDEWWHLFGGFDRSPKQQALHIERFVRSKGWVYA